MILDRLPDPSLPWPITKAGVTLLAKREKCATTAYRDWPKKVPTIGWGQTSGIAIGMEWTVEQCDQDLLKGLIEYTEAVRSMCTVTPTENELAALVVCTWNIGIAGMRGSSMMKLHNAGQPDAAARAFAMWNKAHDDKGNTIEVSELTSRRAAEAALYLEPDEGAPTYPVPQAVAPQPTLAASPTMNTGTAAIGIGSVTAIFSSLKDFGSQVSDFAKDIAADMHLEPVQVMAGVLLIVGAIVVYRRWKQRQNGMA